MNKGNRTNIGVIGCLPSLPLEFPLTMPENSGNMIHAIAPLNMFENAVYNKNLNYKLTGQNNFKDYVNKTCSHLIVTLANTLSIDKPDNEKFYRFRKSLEQYDVPIIVFGLGIQAKDRDIEKAELCEEAVNLIEFLSKKAPALGVRGEYTKLVIEKCCNVRNVFVTGCPSLFSNPDGLRALKENWQKIDGRGGINVTNMAREEERMLLARAIKLKNFIIEPVSRFSHSYHIDLISGKKAELPYFLNGILKKQYQGITSQEEIDDVYKNYYRLFRDVKTWLEFNKEELGFSYGTRFHGNMSTILSGKPALWVTHDARTRELVEFFNLPHIDLHEAVDISYEAMLEKIDYSLFFDKIEKLFENFNTYLQINGLPKIKSI